MNTSQSFMDKQIMDLSNSQSSNDYLDLMNNPDENHTGDSGGGSKKEEILPNYDFLPIRPVGTSSPPQLNQNHHHQVSNYDSTHVGGGAGALNSADSKTNSGVRNYGSLDTVEPVKVISEKDRNIYDAALLSDIDRTMKKHTDNLLHALEGVSARLSQLETRSRHLENSVDDLKVSVGNNYGSTDGKMRQIENILREVQAGVQVVKDKQEILEAQMQLSKLQASKSEQQSESQTSGHVDAVQQVGSASMQHVASAPMQSHQQLPPAALTQTPPIFPPPNAPPQNLPPPPPSQFPQNQIPPLPQHDPYFLPPGLSQTPETPNQQYQVPPPQHIPPPLPSQPQTQLPPQYQPPPPQYSQPPPPPQQYPSQPQLPVGHHSEEPPYMKSHHSEEPPYIPSQSYPPSIHQSSGAPPQQFYGAPPMMYEPPLPPQSSRPNSGFSYSSSTGHNENFYGGPQPQYNVGSPRKSQQISPPNMGPSSGSGYPQLPTARILPQALPTASGVGGGGSGSGSGSGSGGGSGNRVPIDDVVDKVTSMGFSREQVRAAVRKLTENGQSVDLNIVLDKVMNDGVEGGPQRGWFGS